MKKIVLAAIAATAVATVAPAAHAVPGGYYGQCFMDIVDTAPNTFIGLAEAYIVASPPEGQVNVQCDLFVGGVFNRTVMQASGQAVAAGAATVSYTTDGSRMTLCETVTIDSTVFPTICRPVVPPRS